MSSGYPRINNNLQAPQEINDVYHYTAPAELTDEMFQKAEEEEEEYILPCPFVPTYLSRYLGMLSNRLSRYSRRNVQPSGTNRRK